MKTRRAAGLALLMMAMAGCSTEGRYTANRATEIALEHARESARVDCTAPADCERLWKRTELYVAQRSSTPIRHSDETRIETAEPHTFGALYVWASRTASPGGASTIRLKGMCRGMYRADGTPGWLYDSCADQVRAVEAGFRAFIGAASG
ncbi:MAG: FIG00462646: hypothetical protein [uncultured Paraburkholderia sp.]|nr:MAG: FIG00462646: hypothetical protein [uncultured Paraburkholderia sp.]CAH2799343.1 MAG: FIG00462646: hypothetical protein [uncultured Paraburkholderia sp.]CAH2934316.1 MAG: FIG00462646: hypothetical protein [uncultured Paraburkholderia sp.]